MDHDRRCLAGITSRLLLLLSWDECGWAELGLATLEKLEFWARWSVILASGGWLQMTHVADRMSSEMSTKIRDNRVRLSMQRNPAGLRRCDDQQI